MTTETDAYPTVPGDRRQPLPHPHDQPPQPMVGENASVRSNTSTNEEPTEPMLHAQLDSGLAAILLGTHCNGRQGAS